jgi:glyoxylase-like metal-dependent hydrolase (beta-lactamase superfamily II)
VQIAEGVYWLRVPLPAPLNYINSWLLVGADGWTIVDTGFCTPANVDLWRAVLDGLMAAARVERVVATHMHLDHVGMAGWLVNETGCMLWMTRLEYLSYRLAASELPESGASEMVDFYRQAGWTEDAIHRLLASVGSDGCYRSQPPARYRRLTDGEELRIGAHRWTVVVGNGHSPEHVCLYCPDLGLLISGDQVLPRISSNISVYFGEPDACPAKDWLASLDKLQRRVPDTVLVFPAHQEPFFGLHERLESLRTRQRKDLDVLVRALDGGKRALDLLPTLYKRDVTRDQLSLKLATGEVLSGLNYLLDSGAAIRRINGDGVAWYHAVGASSAECVTTQ